MNDSENNVLKNALNTLPEFQPTDENWLAIQQGLKDIPFKKALKQLPDYQAPAWESKRMQAIIHQEESEHPWLRRLLTIPAKLAAAVVFFMLSIYGINEYFQQKTPQLSSEIATETTTLESATNKDFAEIITLCEADVWVCRTEDFKNLKTDFTELDNAQAELKNAMELYGQDVNLLKQFNELERQKADVLNQLATYI